MRNIPDDAARDLALVILIRPPSNMALVNYGLEFLFNKGKYHRQHTCSVPRVAFQGYICMYI